MAFALPPRPLFGGPIVNRGPEPETMTGQGNLSERRMSFDDDGVGGSVAGCASVCAGIALWVARSRTVLADGENETSYVIGARCSRLCASSGCMCRAAWRVWTYVVGFECARDRPYEPSAAARYRLMFSVRDIAGDLHEDVLPALPAVCQLLFDVRGGRVSAYTGCGWWCPLSDRDEP